MTSEPIDPIRPARALTSTVSGLGLAVAASIAILLVGGVTMAAAGRLDRIGTPIVVVSALAVFVVLLPLRVNVTVNGQGVRYRRPGGQERWIPADSIASAEAVRVGWGAVIGWGIPASTATDRRIVGAGWALHLRLTGREEIWLSTRVPFHVEAVLNLPEPAPNWRSQLTSKKSSERT